jgi:hypothetical protein
MIELLFLLGFSLHNIEEALWLPRWSKYAKKYHPEVSENEFRFAVIIVTSLGYLITFQYFLFSSFSNVSKFIFLGFIASMVLNVLFPHLISTLILKKYAPGTLTGIILNAPIGIYILTNQIKTTNDLIQLLISLAIITIIMLVLIKILFKIGRTLFD